MGRYTYVDDERLPLGPLLCWIKEEDLQQFVAEQAHVSVKWLKGKDSCGNIVDGVPVSVVDSILTAYNVPLWYVYPELGPDWEGPIHNVILAWCPRCPEADPDDLRFGIPGTLVVPASDGTCLWCGEQTGGAEVTPVKVPARTCMSEAVVQRARALYLSGEHLTDVAEVLFKQTTYKNVHSFHKQLQKDFYRRGWPMRLKGVVNIKHGRSRAHGVCVPGYNTYRKHVLNGVPEAPLCAALTRRKKPCRNRAHSGTLYCRAHDPETRELVLLHLKKMRQQTTIPYLREAA